MRKIFRMLLCFVLVFSIVGCDASLEINSDTGSYDIIEYDKMESDIKYKGLYIEVGGNDGYFTTVSIYNEKTEDGKSQLLLDFRLNEEDKVHTALFTVGENYSSKVDSPKQYFGYNVKEYKFTEDESDYSSDMKVLEDVIDYIGYSEKDLLLFIEHYYAEHLVTK